MSERPTVAFSGTGRVGPAPSYPDCDRSRHANPTDRRCLALVDGTVDRTTACFAALTKRGGSCAVGRSVNDKVRMLAKLERR